MSPLEKERLYQEFKERLKRDLFADESNVAQLLVLGFTIGALCAAVVILIGA